MSIKIGITGGIGSGKTIVSHLFGIMGVPVYISDIEAKSLTSNDPGIRRQLISLLGEEIYAGGQLNKQLLASYLFANKENANRINSIIHPRVKEDFICWAARHSHFDIVAMESAILIEAGFSDEVDALLMVYSPLELRISRVINRDSSSRNDVIKRIDSQMSDEEKKKKADFVIINDNKTPIIPQVESIIASLRIRGVY